MKKLLVILTIALPSFLSAQYYEEPSYGNFNFKLKNLDNTKEIATELTKYLRAQNPSTLNFKLAEKIIALSLYLDGFNMDALVLNASLKHNLPLKRHEPYSSLDISKILETQIKKDLFTKNTDKVIYSYYLNDINREITGKDKFPSTDLELKNVNATAGWDGILKNYSVKKITLQNQSSAPVSKITKTAHPDYLARKKSIFQRQATSKGLMVSSNAQGVNNGILSEVIGTVTPISGKSTFHFKRQVGTSMMASLVSAEKALKVRFPNIADGYKIHVSFSNKFSNKDGDSAGAAITVMLLSLFEGLKIDPSVAMTGTISPDWKVGIVGGVASKIRGALKGNCKIVGIPVDNKDAVQDLVILYGIENLWNIQVFSLSHLEEAIDLARSDKSKNLQMAIDKFKDLVRFIPRDLRFSSNSAKSRIVNSLKEVLKLAPNHLSAKVLYNVLSGSTYLRLSFLTSVEEVNRLSADILTDNKIPDEKVKSTLKTLARYAKRVDKRVAPYADQIDKFLSSFMKLEKTVKELKSKVDRGERDDALYNDFLFQKKQFTQNRDLLVKYAENIDKEVETYMKEMRRKLSAE